MKHVLRTLCWSARALFCATALFLPIESTRADPHLDSVTTERRIEQLAQGRVPGDLFGFGSPITAQKMDVRFPGSFVIPGTDTSFRLSGELRHVVLYWIAGGFPNVSSTNAGQNGLLNAIPHSGTVAAARGRNVFAQSTQQSRLNFDTRTPTAWGDVRTFVNFDFANPPPPSNRRFAISDDLDLRLINAYATLGGWLAGQANSNFSDSDAFLQTVSFSGLIGEPGVARVPQLRHTAPLAGWGLPGALSLAIEHPDTEFWAPPFGVIGAFAAAEIPGSPLRSPAPDLNAAWYIPQPWGHVDFAVVLRPTLQLKDGVNIDRTYTGYGAQVSGDVKPRWFGWDRDYVVWSVVGGNAIGHYIKAAPATSTGLVSNYVPGITDANLRVKTVTAWAGDVGHRHYWMPNLYSNFGVGIFHQDLNTLRGVVCSGASTPAARSARSAGTAGCGLNRELTNAVANLFWFPVPFVDVASNTCGVIS